MCSLLASRFFVHRKAIPSIQAKRQWHRGSINFWHVIQQEHPDGQAKFLNYEDLAVPDIESQKISLWSENKHLGVIPVREVINDHLSSGTMLSLRGEAPAKNSLAAPERYDYELRRLKTKTTTTATAAATVSSRISRRRTQRAHTLWLDAHVSPSHLKHLLELAYKFLKPDTGAVDLPVEFHIKTHPLPDLTGLSLFTWGRVDLHPAVILRALPAVAFQVVKPKIDVKGGRALWVIAPKEFKMGSVQLPDQPQQVTSMVEKVVVKKREWMTELIEAGDMTPDGEMTEKGKLNPLQKFKLNEQCVEAQYRGQESEKPPKESDDGHW